MAKRGPTRRPRKPTLCPCHSGETYAACCQPWHEEKTPPTAVLLMRSRYSAYALGNVRYIMATTHPHSPLFQNEKANWRRELKQFCQQTTFISLTILDSQEQANQATVTFRAGLVQAEQDASFTEKSLFQKEAGRWRYVAPL